MQTREAATSLLLNFVDRLQRGYKSPYDHLEIMHLISLEPEWNRLSLSGTSILHQVVLHNQTGQYNECIKTLVLKGLIDINIRDDAGKTPLQYLMQSLPTTYSRETVNILLELAPPAIQQNTILPLAPTTTQARQPTLLETESSVSVPVLPPSKNTLKQTTVFFQNGQLMQTKENDNNNLKPYQTHFKIAPKKGRKRARNEDGVSTQQPDSVQTAPQAASESQSYSVENSISLNSNYLPQSPPKVLSWEEPATPSQAPLPSPHNVVANTNTWATLLYSPESSDASSNFLKQFDNNFFNDNPSPTFTFE